MVTLLTKQHGQQGNHCSEEISGKHSKFGNLSNTDNHSYHMNVAKPGKQDNPGNFNPLTPNDL
jgi:hypothetical protein